MDFDIIDTSLADLIDQKINAHNEKVKFHLKEIARLKKAKEILSSENTEINVAPKVGLISTGVPNEIKIGKEFVRNILKSANKPIQNAEIVSTYFPALVGDEREAVVRSLSVIFNTLEKDGEITKEKKEGIKGNFYRWKK